MIYLKYFIKLKNICYFF